MTFLGACDCLRPPPITTSFGTPIHLCSPNDSPQPSHDGLPSFISLSTPSLSLSSEASTCSTLEPTPAATPADCSPLRKSSAHQSDALELFERLTTLHLQEHQPAVTSRAARKAAFEQWCDQWKHSTVLEVDAPPTSCADPPSCSSMSSNSLPTPENPGRLASAASIATPFQNAISAATAARAAAGKRAPKLVGILATPSPPSVAYAEWTKKACEAVGIEFEIWRTWDEDSMRESPAPSTTSPDGQADVDLESDVEDLIIAANASEEIHGIMVYYPIFGGRQDTYLQQIVDPRKDVEGLHFSYIWNMYHNVRWIRPAQLGGAPGTTSEPLAAAAPTERRRSIGGNDEVVPAGYAKSILPCTPLAVVKCLEALGVYDSNLPYGDRLYGKTITIINRSEVVGRPLAALLSNDGAKVYSVDIGSVQEFNKRLPDEDTSTTGRSRSNVVLSARAANSSRRLRPHHVVRPCGMDAEACIRASNVIISGVPSANYKIPTEWIPQGATTVNFSSEKNFEKDARSRAAVHLPAIGKTTIAMLQRNLLRLVEYREMGDAQSANAGPSQPGKGPGPGPGPSGGGDGPHSGDTASGGRPNFPSGPGGPQGGNGPSGGGGGHFSHPSQHGYAASPAHGNNALGLKSSSPGLHSMELPVGGYFSRTRASTLSLPRPAAARERIVGAMPSPTYPASQMGSSVGSMSTTSTWDWRRSRRDSVASGTTTYSVGCASPSYPQHPSIHPHSSPLLFAPVGAQAASRTSTGSQASQRNTSGGSSSGPYGSRPGTPVSPLLMDGLSVEDVPSIHQELRDGEYMPRRPSVLERPAMDRITRDMPQRARGSPQDSHMMLDQSPRSQLAFFPQTSRFEGQHSQQGTASPPPTQILPQGDRFAHSRRRRRPPYSYSSLIAQAIASSPEGRMTLREIYTWISNALPHLYSMDGPEGQGWQNTVRHNLSLNKSFIKTARTAQDIYDSCASGNPNLSQAARGKGGWWTLDVAVAQAQLGPNYKGGPDADSGNEGEGTPSSVNAPLPAGRAPRRRRTSSFAPSIASVDGMDEFQTSAVDVPSVLARPGSTSTGHVALSPPTGTVGMPSVLQRPRTRSMERDDIAVHMAMMQAQAQAHAHLGISGRARGHTTSAAFERRPIISMGASPQQHPVSLRQHFVPQQPQQPQQQFMVSPRLPPQAMPMHMPYPPGPPTPALVASPPVKRKLDRDESLAFATSDARVEMRRSPLAGRADLPCSSDDDEDELEDDEGDIRMLHSTGHSALRQALPETHAKIPLDRREHGLSLLEAPRSGRMAIRDLLNS